MASELPYYSLKSSIFAQTEVYEALETIIDCIFTHRCSRNDQQFQVQLWIAICICGLDSRELKQTTGIIAVLLGQLGPNLELLKSQAHELVKNINVYKCTISLPWFTTPDGARKVNYVKGSTLHARQGSPLAQ